MCGWLEGVTICLVPYFSIYARLPITEQEPFAVVDIERVMLAGFQKFVQSVRVTRVISPNRPRIVRV